MARHLAKYLRVTHIELDTINYPSGGVALDMDDVPEFRRRVDDTLAGLETWVIDGNYSRVRDLVWTRGTALVWLDYPSWLVLLRLLSRTMRRLITREALPNGHRTSFKDEFLSRKSLFLQAFREHGQRRRTYPQALSEAQHAHLRTFRHRSPRETESWLRKVEAGELTLNGSPE